jgi:hypothetical protein
MAIAESPDIIAIPASSFMSIGDSLGLANEDNSIKSISEIEQMPSKELDHLVKHISCNEPGLEIKRLGRGVSDKALEEFIKSEALEEEKSANKPIVPTPEVLEREQRRLYKKLLESDQHCATVASLTKAAGKRQFVILSVNHDLANEEAAQ